MGKNSKKDDKKKQRRAAETKDSATSSAAAPQFSKKDYERELFNLQIELVKMQDWVKHTGARIVIVFEGRDAAARAGLSNAFWNE